MKKYLGDGVYLENDGWHLILTTSNGLSETNRIYLDPRCVENLLEYIKESNHE
jgi:hypothetical protein